MKLDRQKDRSVIDRYETNRLCWGIITTFKAGMFLFFRGIYVNDLSPFQGDIRQRFIPFFSFVQLKLTYSPLKSIYFPISAKTSRTIILLHTVGKQNYLKRGENMFKKICTRRPWIPTCPISLFLSVPGPTCPISLFLSAPGPTCPISLFLSAPGPTCPISLFLSAPGPQLGSVHCTTVIRPPVGDIQQINQSINQTRNKRRQIIKILNQLSINNTTNQTLEAGLIVHKNEYY